uniref:DNA topoisomerase 6 subunit B n=1 Tax=Rhizophora mucronata TaxID=61149 RepID=A0A2P2LAN3_RHIMU
MQLLYNSKTKIVFTCWTKTITSRVIKFGLTKQLMDAYYLLISQRLYRHFWTKVWTHFPN